MGADPVDDFIALPSDQQLTTLQALAPDVQDRLLDQVKQRRSAVSNSTAGVAGAIPGLGTVAAHPVPPAALQNVAVPANITQAEKEGNASVPMEIQNQLVGAAKAIPRGAVTGVAAAIGAHDPFTGEDARDELQRGIESAVAPAASHGGNIFTQAVRGGAAGLDAGVGGDPTAGGANWDQGNYGKALADYLAVPLAFHFGVKSLPSLPGMSSDQPVPPAGSTAQMAVKVASPDVGGTERFTAPGIIPALTERLKQAARDSGVTDENLKSMFPSGNRELLRPSTWFKGFGGDVNTTPVQQGLANRNALWDKFTQGYEDQYQGMLDPFKSAKTDAAARAAATLRSSVTSAEATASPALATATDAIANRVEEAGKGGNLGQLDTLRKEFNKAADRVYQQRAAGVSDSDLQVADANRRAADAIRSATYDDLAQFASGSPSATGDVFDAQRAQIQQLQQEHGAAIELADAAKKQGLAVQPAENILRQKGRVAYTMTGSGTSAAKTTSMRPQYMLQRALSYSPQAEQNVLMRKSLSNLGTGGANPSTSLTPRTPFLQLPAIASTPPITSVPIETAGAPNVTGGVFPARPEISSPARISPFPQSGEGEVAFTDANKGIENRYPGQQPLHGLSPLTPSAYAYHRNPFFVTDYVGSGARGEPAAMPGTARGQIEVHTAADAARALTGYEKYIETPEFKKLDVSRQKQIVDTMDSLHTFANQGEGIGVIGPQPALLPQLTTHPAVAATRPTPTAAARTLPKLSRAAVVTGQAAQRGQSEAAQ